MTITVFLLLKIMTKTGQEIGQLLLNKSQNTYEEYCIIMHFENISIHCENGTEPFGSRANSLPGANRPIGPGPIHSLALSLPGHFVPWNFRSAYT